MYGCLRCERRTECQVWTTFVHVHNEKERNTRLHWMQITFSVQEYNKELSLPAMGDTSLVLHFLVKKEANADQVRLQYNDISILLYYISTILTYRTSFCKRNRVVRIQFVNISNYACGHFHCVMRLTRRSVT